MAAKVLTQADINMAQLLVLLAEDLGEPLEPEYQALADAVPTTAVTPGAPATQSPSADADAARAVSPGVPSSGEAGA